MDFPPARTYEAPKTKERNGITFNHPTSPVSLRQAHVSKNLLRIETMNNTPTEVLTNGTPLVAMPSRKFQQFTDRPVKQQLGEITLSRSILHDFSLAGDTEADDRRRAKALMDNLTMLSFHLIAPDEFGIDDEAKRATVDFIERVGLSLATGLPTYL